MFVHFGDTVFQALFVDVQSFEGLAAGDELLGEIEAFVVDGGKDDGRGPGRVDGIEAHDEGVSEDAEEDDVERGDGEDAVHGDDRFVDEWLEHGSLWGGWSGFN